MIKPVIYDGQPTQLLFGGREQLAFSVEAVVKDIIADVRARGDEALFYYSRKFDGYGGSLSVSPEEFTRAKNALGVDYKAMIGRAADNIRAFHLKQKRDGFEIKRGGRTVGQKVTPVSSAALYIPGGTAAYPSTVLMNAIPAVIAGVKRVVIATPVKADGTVRAEVLYAAEACGVTEVYKMGGAQAIAALAYGTQSVPRVDKITGPGNAYVAEAKRQVAGVACGIDMVAGPSEILVIADDGANAAHVAADMLSQAEHDVNASALLVTLSTEQANAVIAEIYSQAQSLPRRDIALKSIERNCKVIVAQDLVQAVTLADGYAPEHLELCVADPFALLPLVNNAGSVFLGYNTPEALGDYYAGANHTLPTGGSARFSSPLSVNDFVKTTQYIYYDAAALGADAADVTAFARSEGLDGHANSVDIRVKGGV